MFTPADIARCCCCCCCCCINVPAQVHPIRDKCPRISFVIYDYLSYLGGGGAGVERGRAREGGGLCEFPRHNTTVQGARDRRLAHRKQKSVRSILSRLTESVQFALGA